MTKFFQNDKKTLSCYSVMLFLSLAHSYWRLFSNDTAKPYSNRILILIESLF
ncbi:hypothetical protein [Helicobacter pylori]|uniref:hypothetical protein n=1 Tax=Helicobacter pylori TaxID=210 RepID=UPI003F8FF4D8